MKMCLNCGCCGELARIDYDESEAGFAYKPINNYQEAGDDPFELIELSSDSSAGDNSVCPVCGGEVADIDEEIVEYIYYLNKAGIKTRFCCAGHLYNDFTSFYILIDWNASNFQSMIALCCSLKLNAKILKGSFEDYGFGWAYRIAIDSLDASNEVVEATKAITKITNRYNFFNQKSIERKRQIHSDMKRIINDLFDEGLIEL